MRAAVKKVAEYFPTAIISGRSRDKVVKYFYITHTMFFLLLLLLSILTCWHTHLLSQLASLVVLGFNSDFLCPLLAQVNEFVGLTELYYAGSHGMDIIGPVRQSVSDNHTNCIIRSTDKQVLGFNVSMNFYNLFINLCWTFRFLSSSVLINELCHDLQNYRVRKLTYSNLLLNLYPWLMRYVFVKC